MEEEEMEGAPEWITTFVDMISLLVTFFILLFTFSSIDMYESFSFATNITGTRGIFDNKGHSQIEPPDNDFMKAMDIRRGAEVPHARPADKLPESLETMGQKLTEDDIEFNPLDTADGLVIRFDENTAFRPGSAEVSPQLRKALTQLGEVMENYPQMMVLEGHTDSHFSPSPRYPNAEALSCARASAAAQVIIETTEMSPERLQITGFGSRAPLNNNATPSERTANRRVEVRILSMDEQRALDYAKRVH